MSHLTDCIDAPAVAPHTAEARATQPSVNPLPQRPGSVPQWVDLIPAGVFFGRDGRGPYRNEHPGQVIAATRELGLTAGLPIDFDHAIDFGAPHGAPAPAAGWIRELRQANGVIQGRVEWTAAGAQALSAKSYRYLSPVFEFDADGTVRRLLRAAVTNNPNLHLTAIATARGGDALIENLRRIAHQLAGLCAAPSALGLRAAQRALARARGQAAARLLGADELELCRMQSVDPARFALERRARMSGRPLVMAPRSERRAVSTAGPPETGEAERLRLAADEIERFLQKPEPLTALQHLVNAEALLKETTAPARTPDNSEA